MAFRLISEIKNYDWGVPGELSRILGRTSSDQPEAEIWWGRHPLAQCMVDDSGALEDFSRWLDQSNTDFPLLVKLLAAGKPLSIQVHPIAEQALSGFQREEDAGVPRDSPERSYKDTSAKPELVIALSDEFLGLAGFVSEEVLNRRVERWANAGAPDSLAQFVEQFAKNARESFRHIANGNSDPEDAVGELSQWLSSLDVGSLDVLTFQEVHLLRLISEAHPGDPGILFAPLMHHVSLKRGEALFVPAGVVHAYVQGLGLEVMLPSDNVIRAGLTTKHIDVDSFLDVADFSRSPTPHLVNPTGDAQHLTYRDFGPEFRVLALSQGTPDFTVHNPSVCFVEQGEVAVSSQSAQTFRQGETFFSRPNDVISIPGDDTTVWLVSPETP